MLEKIRQMLEQIEKEQNVKIIYAVESGSRAWGFASPDSDYDVRYIYVRRTEDYLRLDPLPDTIEGPLDDVMDFSGWDVRKALELMRRTNPSLMEWAYSPIVYRTSPEWELFASMIPQHFDPLANMHHYMSMTLGNWNKHLKAEHIKIKKYFYVLRPLLCWRWLDQQGTMPPVPFDELSSAMLPEELAPLVAELLAKKQVLDEKELIAHVPELDTFLTGEMERLQQKLLGMGKAVFPDYTPLNALFMDILNRVWQ